MDRYLKETRLIDYHHPLIARLVDERQWDRLGEYDKIGAVYDYVQNEVIFGYNESDDIPASKVLQDGYGQCNTKSTLLMALLRRLGIPCRFHGFTIDKKLQKGVITGLAYNLAPQNIIHSWVELFYREKWVNLEGVILDKQYLGRLQASFAGVQGSFCGYGVATSTFRNPPIEWRGTDTYIQRDGINHDYGVFDSPDDFYIQHGVNLTGLKRLAFNHLIRRWMNANVSNIRNR
ncbi:MAG: transglutaminase family protein [Deltaproteobacteria bacterium]|nr:transglutaminase family protein [Deltaproteobacteria bacterium]